MNIITKIIKLLTKSSINLNNLSKDELKLLGSQYGIKVDKRFKHSTIVKLISEEM
nr:hypothetical protein [uncultured Mediterranean phage uvMED]